MHRTQDGRFTYQAAGDGPGSAVSELLPVVFLHGIGGGAAAWRPQLDQLAGHRRAVAWDMPGYGGSLPLRDAGIPALAEALREFLVPLGLDRAVLVGHSIGGMVVQEYLARYPGGAAAAVLAQTSPAFGPPDGAWQQEFVRARLAPLDAGLGMAGLAEQAVGAMMGPDADQAGADLARTSMAAVPAATYRAMVHALLGFDRKDALSRIQVPTLVLAGTEDTNAPAPMMERMAARISGAHSVVLPGCNHLANLEHPALFNAALDDFLRGLEDTP